MRRDATVNAMFFNLNTLQIEDFTNRGFEDMDAKVIRTPLEPHQTFKDDPLRILRLIRFASRLNYTIDPETEKAMSSQEIGEVLKIKISRERVGIELEKMLKGPDPLRALSSHRQARSVRYDFHRSNPSPPFSPRYGVLPLSIQIRRLPVTGPSQRCTTSDTGDTFAEPRGTISCLGKCCVDAMGGCAQCA